MALVSAAASSKRQTDYGVESWSLSSRELCVQVDVIKGNSGQCEGHTQKRSSENLFAKDV